MITEQELHGKILDGARVIRENGLHLTVINFLESVIEKIRIENDAASLEDISKNQGGIRTLCYLVNILKTEKREK